MDSIDLDFEEDEVPETTPQITLTERKIALPTRRKAISPPRDAEGNPLKSEKRDIEEYEISNEEMKNLHYELTKHNGSDEFVYRCIVAKGVDDMSPFELEKVFAAYRPYRVEVLQEATALLHYKSRQDAATMLLKQTKKLRRVREAKRPEEEGELGDSDEEGELQDENNDQIEIIRKGEDSSAKKTEEDCVVVDIGQVKVPEGPWRVVTEHVPDRRLMLVRFASSKEVQDARSHLKAEVGKRKRKAEHDEEGFSYKWSREEKVRPGLNVFTDDGQELEWDYEHDDRFYEKDHDAPSTKEDSFIKNWGKDQDQTASSSASKAKPLIKKKGRGVARAHLIWEDEDRTDTMRADSAMQHIPRKRMLESRLTGGCFDENVDEIQRDRLDPKYRDPSPTPQPWDRKEKKGVHARITF